MLELFGGVEHFHAARMSEAMSQRLHSGTIDDEMEVISFDFHVAANDASPSRPRVR